MDKHFSFSFVENQVYFTITDDSGNIEEYKTGQEGRELWQLFWFARMNMLDGTKKDLYIWRQIAETCDFNIIGKSQAATKAYIRRWFRN